MDNSNNMSDLFKQVSSMIEKDGIPDNLKEIISNMNNSDNKESSDSSNGFENLDINTILKIKNIMDGMNSKDDPRANLLRSLKPYLKDSRKSKIDQYVQFLNMSKLLDMFKNSGGESK